MLSILESENIVQFYEYGADSSFHYIVMEFCEGGDLSYIIKENKPLSENKFIEYFK